MFNDYIKPNKTVQKGKSFQKISNFFLDSESIPFEGSAVCHICTETIEVNFENEEIVLTRCKKVAVKDTSDEKLVHIECFEAI
jgi:hypothetical protein